MKYLDVLKQKGLDVDVLSRKMKAEVKRLEKLSNVVETIATDELSEEEAEEYKKLLSEIVKLDDALAKDIKRFDLDKYNERVERVNKLNNKTEAPKETPKETPKVETPKVEEPKEEPKTEEELKIEKGLWELKQSVQVDTSSFKVEDAEEMTQPEEPKEEVVEEEQIEEEVEDVEKVEAVEEAEEFEKVKEVSTKKSSLSKIAVGVGALILTWGLVNILKER